MKWKGGKLESAAIHALKDGPVNVRYAEKTATISIKPDGVFERRPRRHQLGTKRRCRRAVILNRR